MTITDSPRGSAPVAALGLAGLLLAACGGTAVNTATPAGQASTSAAGTSPGGSVAPTDPASGPPSVAAATAVGGDAPTLVTEQEATSVLGEDPGPGSPLTSHGATQCQYGSYQKGFSS